MRKGAGQNEIERDKMRNNRKNTDNETKRQKREPDMRIDTKPNKTWQNVPKLERTRPNKTEVYKTRSNHTT